METAREGKCLQGLVVKCEGMRTLGRTAYGRIILNWIE
jgi:hypothetical protein